MYKVTVRVVDTMATNCFHNRLENVVTYTVENLLSMGCGGVTVNDRSIGYWKDDSGNVVKEGGHDIWTLVDGGSIIEQIESLCRTLKRVGEQDCILFTVEEVKEVKFV